MSADEAIATLDIFLDNAMMANLASVRIIHGKGTGVLRKAVQDGNYEEGTFMSGQIAGMLKELHPCEEILKGMTAQAEDLLKNAYKRFE